MAVTLDQTIAQKQHSWLSCDAQQPDILGADRDRRSPACSCRFATDAFATSKNLYNITRNFTFIAIIALGMTMVIITGGIDLSVGSVLCLCSMVLAVTMHAGYSIEVGHRRVDADRAGGRCLQRRADRLSRLSALRGDARHAVDRPQPGDGGVRTTPWCSSSGPTTTSCWRSAAASTFGIANPVIYMIVLALITGFVLRWTRFGRYVFAIGGNEHAAMLTGVPVRRDQGRGLHDLRALGRHRRHRPDRLARAR